jgi:hypothetical protein
MTHALKPMASSWHSRSAPSTQLIIAPMQINVNQPEQVVERKAESPLVVVLLDIPLVWELLGNDYKRAQVLSSSRQLLASSRTTRETIHMWHCTFAEIDRLQEARDDLEHARLQSTILQDVLPERLREPYPYEISVSWETWMFSSD